MKKLITILFAGLLTFSLSAQTDQGVILLDVGGDLLNYTSLTLQDYDPNNPFDEYKETTFGINGKVGYFFTDGSYSWGSSEYENDPGDDEDGPELTAWSIGVGYSIYLSDMISISPSIAFGGIKSVLDDGAYSYSGYPYYNYSTEDEEITYSGISFNIGISLFLE